MSKLLGFIIVGSGLRPDGITPKWAGVETMSADDNRIATITLSRTEGNGIDVAVDFAGKQTAADAMASMGAAATGIIEAGLKFGKQRGLTEEESLKAMGLED